jgi:signal peptidase II
VRVFWSVFFFVLVFDAFCKVWVYQSIEPMDYYEYTYPYGGVDLFSNFLGIEGSLVYAKNTGAAWGLFAGYQIPLLVVRIALIGVLVVSFFSSNRQHPIAMAMILAGAFGNILDYFFYGHVVDFFHFILWGWDYPVFNIADSAIFLGIASLCIDSFVKNGKKPTVTSI